LIKDDDIAVTLTTGDVDYPGTALEVDAESRELFHVVIDQNGEMQALFIAQNKDYRISIKMLERIIESAKEEVRYIEDFGA
jgi:hypothetical protein